MHTLPAADRFRCVKFERRNGAYSDWTFEREFRHKGDIKLENFDPNDVLVIVANRAERFRLLAQEDIVPWPVVAFDYAFAEGEPPYARLTGRQKALGMK